VKCLAASGVTDLAGHFSKGMQAPGRLAVRLWLLCLRGLTTHSSAFSTSWCTDSVAL
jgi:hypothetical protein